MMRRMLLLGIVLGAGSLVTSPAISQESSSFKLREQVVNAGGDPNGGLVLTSPSFRIRLDSIGEDVMGVGLSSASLRMDVGFTPAYPPPGEVTGVRFGLDGVTLSWSPEKSVGAYAIYRGSIPAFLPAYGVCSQSDLSAETATDSSIPAVGGGFFYLLTGRNRLGEEGTKGFNSAGAEMPNSNPCP